MPNLTTIFTVLFIVAVPRLSTHAAKLKTVAGAQSQNKPTDKTKDSLKQVITKLQKTYDDTSDFRANFKQKYHHKILKRSDESEGKVSYKKPGWMRWDYQKPTPKSFIVDGKSLWIYQNQDHLAYFDKCFKQDSLTASIAFLWGGGKIVEQFESTWFEGVFGEQSDHHIALSPKQKNSIFRKLILVIDPKSFRVKQSIVVDLEGNINQFIFSDLQFNQKIPSKEFQFVAPKGTHTMPVPGSCAK